MKSATVTPDTGAGPDVGLAESRNVASTDSVRLVPLNVVVSVGTGGWIVSQWVPLPLVYGDTPGEPYGT